LYRPAIKSIPFLNSSASIFFNMLRDTFSLFGIYGPVAQPEVNRFQFRVSSFEKTYPKPETDNRKRSFSCFG